MDLKELDSFVAVGQLRSFVKAAKLLGVGQSTVTKHIRRLEAETGRELFERSTRPIQLSAAGLELLQAVAPLVKRVKDLMAEPNGVSVQAPVVIACAHGFLNELMLRAVTAFRTRHPHIRLRLRLGTQPEVTAMVVAGEVDFAITPTPEQIDAIAFQPLALSNRVLITPIDHDLLRRDLTSMADIAAYPLILLGHRTQTRRLLEEAFREAGVEYEVAVEVDSMDIVKRYVQLGLGVAVGHSIALDPEDFQNLGVVPLSPFLPSVLVGIVSGRRRLPEKAQEFVSMMRDLVKTAQAKPGGRNRLRRL